MHVSLQNMDRIQTVRGEFRGTTIGGKDFGSARLEGEDAGRTWVVMRYAMPDGDTLRLVGLDRKAVAEEVRSRAIAGSVSEEKSEAGGEPVLTVTLEAKTRELRAWLEKAGDRILTTDKPLVLRRVR
jgi:hypothetical protein